MRNQIEKEENNQETVDWIQGCSEEFQNDECEAVPQNEFSLGQEGFLGKRSSKKINSMIKTLENPGTI